MAISSMKQTDKTTTYVNQYVADLEADVKDLPTNCNPGSTCVVIATGNVYMLNGERKWKLFGGG